MFVRGSDNALWQRSYAPGTGWSGWTSLGGTILDPPATASPATDRIVVFVRGADSAMWHRSFEGDGWDDLGFARRPPSWQPVGNLG